MAITELTRTETPITIGPMQPRAPLCANCEYKRAATTRVLLRDQDGFMRRVFAVCDEHKWSES